jgi:hypothetical protein
MGLRNDCVKWASLRPRSAQHLLARPSLREYTPAQADSRTYAQARHGEEKSINSDGPTPQLSPAPSRLAQPARAGACSKRQAHTHSRASIPWDSHSLTHPARNTHTHTHTHTHTQRRIGNENESIEWALALAQASACLLGPASKSKSLPSKSLPSQIETRTHKQGNGKGKGKAQSPSLWSPPWPRLGLALASPSGLCAMPQPNTRNH